MTLTLKYLLKDFPTADVAAALRAGYRAKAQLRQATRTPPAPTEFRTLAPPAKRVRTITRRSGKIRPGATYSVGAQRNRSRIGTWTEFMIRTALNHGVVRDAETALRLSNTEWTAKRIDWNWLAEQNYIVWGNQ